MRKYTQKVFAHKFCSKTKRRHFLQAAHIDLINHYSTRKRMFIINFIIGVNEKENECNIINQIMFTSEFAINMLIIQNKFSEKVKIFNI